MSYCVNCGVQLAKSEKKCPLCGVEVINPLEPYAEKAPRPYPHLLDPISDRINRRFIAALITIGLIFPAVLCATINYSLDNKLSWSYYVIGALITVWVFVVPFFLMKKRTVSRLFIPDVLILLLYLFLIAAVRGDFSWYWPLGVPLVLIAGGFIFLNIQLIALSKIRGLAIPAAALFSIGLMVTGFELVLTAGQDRVRLVWSLYVLIPCFAVALILLVIAQKKALTEEIRRRLHL